MATEEHVDSNGHAGGVVESASSLAQQPLLKRVTAHNWETEKCVVYDDETLSFFWRAHTLTVLVLMSCVFIYVAVFEEVIADTELNIKRAIVAVLLVFILIGVLHAPDGPFRRPHPALWRAVLCISILYNLALIFIFFQNVDDARHFMSYIDPELGKPLPERSYAEDCTFYDSNSTDPWHNIKSKMDCFITAHFFGWWLKAIMLRSYWLCNTISILFEILEYSLEHQLPNFAECWWDHWIFDALVCNGLGIYFGMLTCEYLKMRPYHWRGMWNIPSYRGKMKRIVDQFTPYNWVPFEWKPTQSLGRWLAILGVIVLYLLCELCTFYLKFILWVPPEHWMNPTRLALYLLTGSVAMREFFQFFDDPKCTKFGYQSWIVVSSIVVEILIVVKFDKKTISMPPPPHIKYLWIGIIVSLIVWTIWKFFIWRDIPERILEEEALMAKERRLEKKGKHQARGGGGGSSVSHPERQKPPPHSTLKRRQLRTE